MKVILALIAVIGVAHARPQTFLQSVKDALVSIFRFENTNNGLGEYSFDVEGSDGQIRGERRYVIDRGTDQERPVVEGYYGYKGTDDKEYLVGYKADDGGFQPEGTHLPPAANVKRRPPQVGIPSKAIASLSGGGLG